MDPITIAMIGSGLLGLFGAKKSSDAAKNAADTQARSAREALDFMRGLYEQNRSDFSPYADAGYGAVARLSAMLARSPFATGDESQYAAIPPNAPSLQSGQARPAPMPLQADMGMERPTSGELPNGVRWSLPGGSGDAVTRGTPSLRAMMPRTRSAPQRGGGMVLMRHAVSGDARWVPASREQEYEKQGARRVR